ncbi:MAG: Ig-like domain-containing protein [Lachnospiraceae bacterium]|jgi:hypothetical protein|nr:Ig-like domain-containing protein [Lachnospiraceae bacterium]
MKRIFILLLLVFLLSAADRREMSGCEGKVRFEDVASEKREDSAEQRVKHVAGHERSTESKIESKIKKQSETEREIESKSMRRGDSRGESGTEIGIKSKRESEMESGMESGTESGMESGTESETERGTESETESESEDESETQSETPIRKVIKVKDVWVDYPKASREYDDTQRVKLQVKTEQVGEGDVSVYAEGMAEKKNVGKWWVKPSYTLRGEDREEFELEILEPDDLYVSIRPKVLDVKIADAKKEYFAEAELSNLVFQIYPFVNVSGFVKNGEAVEEPPEGFKAPEIVLNTKVITKESPMYDKDGNRMAYEGALRVRVRENGRTIPAPPDNYCYDLSRGSKHYRMGSVTVVKSKGAVAFQMEAVDGGFCKRGEILWVSRRSVLAFQPEKGSGFNKTVVYGPLQESTTCTFAFQRVDQNGTVRAESEPQKCKVQVDGEGPKGNIFMRGKENFPQYSREKEVLETQFSDQESGVKSLAYCFYAAPKTLEQIIENGDHAPWIKLDGPVTIQQEGAWQMAVRAEDWVGNVSYSLSPDFVLDFTEPRIMVNGTKDGAATRQKAELEILFTDQYLKEESLRVELSHEGTGRVTLIPQKTRTREGVRWRFRDIPRKKERDGHYKLTVSAEDLAGNMARKEMNFSVNRYGSVYYPDLNTQERIQAYYLAEEFPVVIREINVNRLVQTQITCSRNGETSILKEGRDYTVNGKEQGNKSYGYTYEIKAECFAKEGRYSVMVSSLDQAGNRSDSRAAQTMAEFVIDKTPPRCVVTGIEPGAVYREREREVRIDAGENYCLDQLQVFQNGELVAETDQEQLTWIFSGSSQWQTLRVYARDKAGNEYKGDEITVWVSDKGIMPQKEKMPTAEKTGDGTKEDNTERFTERSEAEPERRAHGQEAGGTHETTRGSGAGFGGTWGISVGMVMGAAAGVLIWRRRTKR